MEDSHEDLEEVVGLVFLRLEARCRDQGIGPRCIVALEGASEKLAQAKVRYPTGIVVVDPAAGEQIEPACAFRDVELGEVRSDALEQLGLIGVFARDDLVQGLRDTSCRVACHILRQIDAVLESIEELPGKVAGHLEEALLGAKRVGVEQREREAGCLQIDIHQEGLSPSLPEQAGNGTEGLAAAHAAFEGVEDGDKPPRLRRLARVA